MLCALQESALEDYPNEAIDPECGSTQAVMCALQYTHVIPLLRKVYCLPKDFQVHATISKVVHATSWQGQIIICEIASLKYSLPIPIRMCMLLKSTIW